MLDERLSIRKIINQIAGHVLGDLLPTDLTGKLTDGNSDLGSAVAPIAEIHLDELDGIDNLDADTEGFALRSPLVWDAPGVYDFTWPFDDSTEAVAFGWSGQGTGSIRQRGYPLQYIVRATNGGAVTISKDGGELFNTGRGWAGDILAKDRLSYYGGVHGRFGHDLLAVSSPPDSRGIEPAVTPSADIWTLIGRMGRQAPIPLDSPERPPYSQAYYLYAPADSRLGRLAVNEGVLITNASLRAPARQYAHRFGNDVLIDAVKNGMTAPLIYADTAGSSYFLTPQLGTEISNENSLTWVNTKFPSSFNSNYQCGVVAHKAARFATLAKDDVLRITIGAGGENTNGRANGFLIIYPIFT